MNKRIVYSVVACFVGLGLGYLVFKPSEEKVEDRVETAHNHEEAEQMWTCSMHPQIMREEPGDCPICGMDLIPAEAETSGLSANQFRMTDNALALADIQTTVIGSGNTEVTNGLNLSGKIVINADETATQPAHFDGRIESLSVTSVGQQIRMGQKVATVYSPALIAAQQELITASKLKESQPKLYEAVRNKFKNWKIHSSILDQVEQSGEPVTRFPIYSQVSGIVSEIEVNEGAHVMDGKPIFKVNNLNTVWAEFDAYENQISRLQNGQQLAIAVNAYPDKTFKGSISFIDPILNSETRTVIVRATLVNKEDLLKPGMFVEASLTGAQQNFSGELTIPASAVMWTGERSLVYVKPNPTQPVFEMREVDLGLKQGAFYQIKSGLSLGEELVTNGTFTVDAAAQLRGKKSMMNTASNNINTAEAADMKLPIAFQNTIKAEMKQYLKLKDAFVDSDTMQVSRAAEELLDGLSGLDASILETMERSHFSKIKQRLQAIIAAETLIQKREEFVVLNENMVALVSAIQSLNPTLYVQRCPMANDSKGAVWLSEFQEIENPYYGEAMATCGSVINTFSAE
ncbi:efflux RND transporter periplasmic adaptor subunit [Leeuwenhoekiella marinoflava]|uniref:Cu(I)/Ag(I) efflux system membrane fusion protein n=2 Tax=Leeuwenhoekiella marinoflava TaxID=988 RepID=A0A4Q0PM70_9FLAO|nr:efflux RND transporter periplasmic adaptor subunit [Leeuwenhoekiella marinoflava]RXG30732.1 Cu(I)/Ag(I) efflux system membrane fusion protein [Leeuwenhoekiella marinoflava]SHF18286.1 membrane fusion protein, Cu(I)/Ag(I) efflux system [Leeuwenhoekiella marinoflava DSM 3653]